MLAGKKEGDYEAMLAGGVSTAAASVPREETDELGTRAVTSDQRRFVRDLMAAVPPPTIPVSLPPVPSGPPPVIPPPIRAETSSLWRRVEVAPGFELHVRADFLLPDTRAKRESLLLAVLESLQPGGRS